MKKSVSTRTALIFGGAGFIGSNWARHLFATTDANLHLFDNLSRPGVQFNLRELHGLAAKSRRLKVTIADIRDAAAVERAVRDATEIYHFAAQVAVTTAVADPQLDFSVNLCGTFNILEAARKSAHRPFLLFTSTNKVYGELHPAHDGCTATRYLPAHPEGVSESQVLDFHSPYGCSKGAADQYVRDYARIYQLPSVVFRMSCIAGPFQFGNEDQGWVAHFLYSALQGNRVMIYGDGRQVRDVLAVHDLMRAFEAARENQERTAGQIYNVGGGPRNTTSILELMQEIKRLTGCSPDYSFSPVRPGDQLVYVTDFRKLRNHTGWQPRMSFRATLKCMYEWWNSHSELFATERASVPGTRGYAEVAA
jgi:CDP-paratose 2-epimerase